MQNYQDKLVLKPWGWEYLVYQNSDVAVWHLAIREGQQTSMHCHPNKKTGLIILDGDATVSFLGDKKIVSNLDKIMIRPGLFHSTKSNSGTTHLLEIETPVDKENIVRIMDEYGRAGQPYENVEDMPSINTLEVPRLTYGHARYLDLVNILITKVSKKDEFYQLIRAYSNRKFMILSGGIEAFNHEVCGPGDILNSHTLSLLLKNFDCKPTELMCIG